MRFERSRPSCMTSRGQDCGFTPNPAREPPHPCRRVSDIRRTEIVASKLWCRTTRRTRTRARGCQPQVRKSRGAPALRAGRQTRTARSWAESEAPRRGTGSDRCARRRPLKTPRSCRSWPPVPRPRPPLQCPLLRCGRPRRAGSVRSSRPGPNRFHHRLLDVIAHGVLREGTGDHRLQGTLKARLDRPHLQARECRPL